MGHPSVCRRGPSRDSRRRRPRHRSRCRRGQAFEPPPRQRTGAGIGGDVAAEALAKVAVLSNPPRGRSHPSHGVRSQDAQLLRLRARSEDPADDVHALACLAKTTAARQDDKCAGFVDDEVARGRAGAERKRQRHRFLASYFISAMCAARFQRASSSASCSASGSCSGS